MLQNQFPHLALQGTPPPPPQMPPIPGLNLGPDFHLLLVLGFTQLFLSSSICPDIKFGDCQTRGSSGPSRGEMDPHGTVTPGSPHSSLGKGQVPCHRGCAGRKTPASGSVFPNQEASKASYCNSRWGTVLGKALPQQAWEDKPPRVPRTTVSATVWNLIPRRSGLSGSDK